MIHLINKYNDKVSRLESEIMLASILRCSRNSLYVNETLPDKDAESTYESFVSRRLSGEPVQYIVGSTELKGLDLMVKKNYDMAAMQLLFTAGMAWVFGGMGYWNDIGFKDKQDHERYKELTLQLYDNICDVVLAAVNS